MIDHVRRLGEYTVVNAVIETRRPTWVVHATVIAGSRGRERPISGDDRYRGFVRGRFGMQRGSRTFRWRRSLDHRIVIAFHAFVHGMSVAIVEFGDNRPAVDIRKAETSHDGEFTVDVDIVGGTFRSWNGFEAYVGTSQQFGCG